MGHFNKLYIIPSILMFFKATDYRQASAYRPISLTSCLGKCMEKLIATRLYGFVEHHNLLDREHEGFRRYRGTSEALLKTTQDIVNGIKKKRAHVGGDGGY